MKRKSTSTSIEHRRKAELLVSEKWRKTVGVTKIDRARIQLRELANFLMSKVTPYPMVLPVAR